MPVIVSGLTDIGKVRKSNQDAIHVNEDIHFFLVADGMGGHNGGDIASAMAVKYVPEYILENRENSRIEVCLRDSFLYANRSIFERAQRDTVLQGMGTTLVSLLFKKSSLFVGNVGDSRAYLVNKQKIFQLTEDHSLVQEKINLGIYSRTEASHDPMKNILIRTIGFEPRVEVDIYHYEVSRNDIFFICSDGLHGKVSDRDMLYIIKHGIPDPSAATEEDVERVVQALINQANHNGGQDNISVILAIAQ